MRFLLCVLLTVLPIHVFGAIIDVRLPLRWEMSIAMIWLYAQNDAKGAYDAFHVVLAPCILRVQNVVFETLAPYTAKPTHSEPSVDLSRSDDDATTVVSPIPNTTDLCHINQS